MAEVAEPMVGCYMVDKPPTYRSLLSRGVIRKTVICFKGETEANEVIGKV